MWKALEKLRPSSWLKTNRLDFSVMQIYLISLCDEICVIISDYPMYLDQIFSNILVLIFYSHQSHAIVSESIRSIIDLTLILFSSLTVLFMSEYYPTLIYLSIFFLSFTTFSCAQYVVSIGLFHYFCPPCYDDRALQTPRGKLLRKLQKIHESRRKQKKIYDAITQHINTKISFDRESF